MVYNVCMFIIINREYKWGDPAYASVDACNLPLLHSFEKYNITKGSIKGTKAITRPMHH